MAATIKWYGKGFLAVFNKEADWNSDAIKVALLASTYTPGQDAHDYFDDVVAHEVAGAGYTAGGVLLGSPTIAYDGPTNVVKLDGNDASWPNSTITARYGVIYDSTPATDATRPLIAYADLGAAYSSVNGTFEIRWNASGIVVVTVA